MKAIKILVEILEFNTALRDLIILGTDKAQARFNAMNKKVNEVEEALVELQDLESYVVGQIGSLSAKLESLSFSDKCIVEYQIKAYTDILQRIRGGEC